MLKFVRQCLEVGVPDHVVQEGERLKRLRQILSSLPGNITLHYLNCNIQFSKYTLIALWSGRKKDSRQLISNI